MPPGSAILGSPRCRTLLWRVSLVAASALLATLLAVSLAMAFPRAFLLVEGEEREADLIIVLGGETLARAELCADLHRKGAARHIIVSGAGDGPVIAHELRTAGVPAGAIFVERDSVSTFENARLTAPLLERMHVRRAFVVTSWFHTRRALACFQRASPKVRFIAVAAPFEWPTARERWRGLAREYAKLLGYWIAHGVPPWTLPPEVQ